MDAGASTLLNAAAPAFAQSVTECRRNNCHTMRSHGGTTVEDWAGLGVALGVVCILAGCLGPIGGGGGSAAAPSGGNRTWADPFPGVPEPNARQGGVHLGQ